MPDMLQTTNHQTAIEVVADLAPPRWAVELAGGAASVAADGIACCIGERFSLFTARVENVPELSPAAFEQRTCEAYLAVNRAVAGGVHLHPVRFWNHVPFITDPADAGRNNYMVFNAARFAAFNRWYGSANRFEHEVATASGIGHWGRDLVIHCLAADAPGAAVNNPRQVAPYHYSQRFGPLPPCFARATRLHHPRHWLLAGGTASVRGEDSVHDDDLASQCRETFVNLAALVGQALGKKLTPSVKLDHWLAAFGELRVYYPIHSEGPAIAAAIAARFPLLKRLEMLHADLCRAELRVEIEGLADLSVLEHNP